MEKMGPSRERTRGSDRGERLDEPWAGHPFPKPRPLTPGQIALAEELRALLRDVDQAEIDQFYQDIDSIADPTSRYWPD